MNLNESKIYFRVDGSSEIGLGHLMRCIALAHMLKKYFQIIFICKEAPDQIAKELRINNFDLIKIRDETSFINKLFSKDIVVLDGYCFDTQYQIQVKASGCKLVCIDDLHAQKFVADLIINHAPDAKVSDYDAEPYTQYALGLSNVLLRPAFLEQAKKNREIKKVETVLICFGGSDNKNLTEETLNVVLKHGNFKKIIVVTGGANNHLEKLNKLIQVNSNVEHHHDVGEKKMIDLMIEAELAIVPASGILFESLAAGCKVISGYYVNNQMAIYNGFKNTNAIICSDQFQDNDLLKALEKVDKFNGVKIIDGNSPNSLINKFRLLKNAYSNIN